jgi:Xaa-Pro aminopeptidase
VRQASALRGLGSAAVADRRPQRVAALADALGAIGLDGVLLTSPANIRYLTGFSGSSALVFATARGELLLVTDFRYKTQAADEIGDLARIVVEGQSLWTGLWQNIPSFPSIEVVGFESAHLVHRDFQRLLEAGARWQWRPTVDVVEGLRERKDADEVAHITAAAAVATRALERTLPHVKAGLTELEVAGVLEHALRSEGSETFPFASIVASGPRSALPHAATSSRVLQRGDFLLLDFGSSVAGYCADITRTVVLGPPSDEQRVVYGVVRAANEAAAGSVRPGMRGRDADAVARDYIDRRGYGDAFGHSLGHGLGLEVHEAPRLSRTADAVLAVGTVVTIEPGIYRPGWGGVRIEDDVHLGTGAADVLTHFTRELLVVG